MADSIANGTAKPVIFIIYSHKDEPEHPGTDDVRWLTYVQEFLAPAVRSGVFDLWVDEGMPPGADWKATIADKLNTCDICILLVSPNSLASDSVVDFEVASIKKRQNVPLFPIVLKPFPRKVVPWLMELNLYPSGGRSLSEFAPNERDKEMRLNSQK